MPAASLPPSVRCKWPPSSAPYDGSYARAGAIVSLIDGLGLTAIGFAPETRGQPLPG